MGARGEEEEAVADGDELGHDVGDHGGLALADEHPHQRDHPRILSNVDGGGGVRDEQRARVAAALASVRLERRVGQRRRVPRRRAAGRQAVLLMNDRGTGGADAAAAARVLLLGRAVVTASARAAADAAWPRRRRRRRRPG